MLISSIAHHTLYFHFFLVDLGRHIACKLTCIFFTVYRMHLYQLFFQFFFLLFFTPSSCKSPVLATFFLLLPTVYIWICCTPSPHLRRLHDYMTWRSRVGKKQSFYKWTPFMVFGSAWRPSVGGASNCNQQSSRLKFVLTSSWRLLAQSKSYFDSLLG